MNGRPMTVILTDPVNRPGSIPTIRLVSTRRYGGNHVHAGKPAFSIDKYVGLEDGLLRTKSQALIMGELCRNEIATK